MAKPKSDVLPPNDIERLIRSAERDAQRKNPLVCCGNDNSSVTRGELKFILSELLKQIATGKAVEVSDGEVQRLSNAVGDLIQAGVKMGKRVDAVATELDLHEHNGEHWTAQQITQWVAGNPPAALPADSKPGAVPAEPAKPSVGNGPADTTGADELKKLSVKAIKDFAAANNVDLSNLPAPLQGDKNALADYVAAALNVQKQNG